MSTFWINRVDSLIHEWFSYLPAIYDELRSLFCVLISRLKVYDGPQGLYDDFTVGKLTELVLHRMAQYKSVLILNRCHGGRLESQTIIWQNIVKLEPRLDRKHVAASVLQKYARRTLVKFQLRKEKEAAHKLQRACFDWLWSPFTRDGKQGIRLRLIIYHGIS